MRVWVVGISVFNPGAGDYVVKSSFNYFSFMFPPFLVRVSGFEPPTFGTQSRPSNQVEVHPEARYCGRAAHMSIGHYTLSSSSTLELVIGIEPTTGGLQNHSSTTELHQHAAW